ncbi:MAG: AtpZ/AtpI family protein [Pyrinomonadaceae bacterium]
MVDQEQQEVVKKTGIVYAAVFSIFASTIACMGLGYLLDRWLGTAPWILVGGIVVGAAVGFYQFVKLISKVNS